MENGLTLVTLGVVDLERAIAFYRDVLGWTPTSTADGVAFFDLDGLVLALWPHRDLAADSGLSPDGLGAYHGFALAQNLRSREEVDAVFEQCASAG
jgi:uncharacterized protein